MRLSVIMLLWSLIPATAEACSCLEPPFGSAFKGSGAVFVGRADSVQIVPSPWPKPAEGPRVRATFSVLCSWKGPQAERTVRVYTGVDDGMCGFKFSKGETYLVYAREDPEHHLLGTSICSRTTLFRRSGDDVDSLRGPYSVSRGWSLPKTGTIWVWVMVDSQPGLGIENAMVTIEGRKEALTTDRYGIGEFRDVTPGRFVLRIRAEGWSQAAAETVHVRAGKFVERYVRLSRESTRAGKGP